MRHGDSLSEERWAAAQLELTLGDMVWTVWGTGATRGNSHRQGGDDANPAQNGSPVSCLHAVKQNL